MPLRGVIARYSAPFARRIRSAGACTGPSTVGRVARRCSAVPGLAPVVCALVSRAPHGLGVQLLVQRRVEELGGQHGNPGGNSRLHQQ
jgi:hypothetical protein